MRHILDVARAGVSFAVGRVEADLRRDDMLLFAMIRALEVVGEASKNVSPAFRNEHPEVPWSQMARTRDRLIHGYDTVNPAVVWDIVRDELPLLIAVIEPLIEAR